MNNEIDWKYHRFAWGSFIGYAVALQLILAGGFTFASFVDWENHFYYYIRISEWDGMARFMYALCYFPLFGFIGTYLFAMIFKGSAFKAEVNE